jgi:Type II secretory pathway, prepilin signal peptidase PulO and related peptidases
MFLKGRCRYCKSKVSLRYPIVEILTACLFILCFDIVGFSQELIKPLILTSFLIIITCIDYDHQLILDKVLIWLAGAGVVINLLFSSITISDMLIAGLIGGGIMLLIALISRGGMGGGDIKFVAALGLWLGIKLTLLTLFLSFVLGGLGGIIVLLLRIKKRKDLIPFGPFIALGAFISVLYGNKIIAWYVNSFMR